jgi:hypothetical protein
MLGLTTKVKTQHGFVDFIPTALVHGKLTQRKIETINRKLIYLEKQQAAKKQEAIRKKTRIRSERKKQMALQELQKKDPARYEELMRWEYESQMHVINARYF